jgi:hypothetical protein
MIWSFAYRIHNAGNHYMPGLSFDALGAAPWLIVIAMLIKEILDELAHVILAAQQVPICIKHDRLPGIIEDPGRPTDTF